MTFVSAGIIFLVVLIPYLTFTIKVTFTFTNLFSQWFIEHIVLDLHQTRDSQIMYFLFFFHNKAAEREKKPHKKVTSKIRKVMFFST